MRLSSVRPSRGVAAVIAPLAVWAVPGLTQTIPTRTLSAPVEYADGFSRISGVRELPDGRVVVGDARDRRVVIVDFRTKTAQNVSRLGAGPVEYEVPTGVFAAGDSTLIIDSGNRRVLVLDPSGKAVRSYSFTADGQRRDGLPFGPPAFIDGRGRLFYRAGVMIGTGAALDSDAVVRYDRRTDAVSTIAHLPNPMVLTPLPGGGVKGSIGPFPFGIQDEWTVTPDGRVAVLRASDYHVEWFADGRLGGGAPIPFERIVVTESEKAEWRRWYTGLPFTGIASDGSTPNRPPYREPVWPAYKGPFGEVIAASNGDLWVERRGREGEPPAYDVISAAGNRIARYVLPKTTVVVGVSNTAVYAARKDADDVLYLQRYPIPR
jgi:hypothetical protein